jgi:SIR2-like protein
MAEDQIDDQEMLEIIEPIHDGLCVPFLGAGANFTGAGYQGLRLGYEVAQELAQTIQAQSPVSDAKNLARVSLQLERIRSRPFLIRRMKELLPDEQRTPSPLIQVLAELPFNLYITTNYDRLLEKALENRNRKVVVQTCEELIGKPDLEDWAAKPAEERSPLVYKIHGTFCTQEFQKPDASSVIVTEDDYIELLTMLGPEAKGIPNLITGKIQISTILFLGYSLEDWDFRAIYKGLIERTANKFPPKSFAIQKNPSPFWKDFWSRKGVIIKNVDIYDFARDLKKAYFKRYPGPQNGGRPTGGQIAAGS